jgi:hypothetical protein
MRLASKPFMLAIFSLALLCGAAENPPEAPAPGIKMTVQRVTGETRREETTFIESDRYRREYRSFVQAVHGDGTLDTRPGPRLAVITRCDPSQMFELNLEDREYVVTTFPQFKPTREPIKARTDNIVQTVAPWVPTVRSELKTVDTGERKNLFGHEARHVIATRITIPLAGSHVERNESVTDLWYIDLDAGTSCGMNRQPRNVSPRHEYYAVGGERYEFIDDGIRIRGFAVESSRTLRGTTVLPDGTKHGTAYTYQEKLTEFYEGPLDPALFEVPGDFRKVRDIRREPPMTLADRWYLARGWVKGMAHDLFK